MSAEPVNVGPFCLMFEADEAWFVFNAATLSNGEVRGASVEEISRTLTAHGERLRGKRLIVDLQDAPVIDSLQIGSLLALSKACRAYGRLALEHVSDGVAKLMRMTSIEWLFDSADDLVRL